MLNASNSLGLNLEVFCLSPQTVLQTRLRIWLPLSFCLHTQCPLRPENDVFSHKCQNIVRIESACRPEGTLGLRLEFVAFGRGSSIPGQASMSTGQAWNIQRSWPKLIEGPPKK